MATAVVGKTTMVKIEKLKPAPYNPRQVTPKQLDAICRSIVEFGLVDPFVARKEDCLVVGGHQRLKALEHLIAGKFKMKVDGKMQPVQFELPKGEVPVVFVEGLDDTRTKMLNLALNKVTGEWHYDMLAELIADMMTSVDVSELTATGFSSAELIDLADIHSENTGDDGTEPGSMTHAPSLTLHFTTPKMRDAVKKMLAAGAEKHEGVPSGDVLAKLLKVKE